MSIKFEGTIWTNAERSEIVTAMNAVRAIGGRWIFNKYVGWSDSKIRYTMKYETWATHELHFSFSELKRAITGGPRVEDEPTSNPEYAPTPDASF